MLKSLPIAVIVLLLLNSSCSTYQYGTVSSTNMSMNESQEFVYENDSIRLIYNFNGHNAPINITVENKLKVPVFIDWHRSSLIINDRSVSYVPIQVKIEGTTESSSYNMGNPNGYSARSGNIDATASLPPSVDFVPPQSYFTRNPIGLTNKFINNVPVTDYHRVRYPAREGYSIPVKAAVFTEGSSPLRFRSYLTLMIGNRDALPVAYEHSFFVSQLIRSSQVPSAIRTNADRGNQFFIMKPASGTGVVVGFALLTAVSAGLMADKVSDTE